ncbi:esterase-like activity of phytase family protein [Streptomyces sp. NPDC056660]|uniref:caspase, EACC1-associated type n=1 Tax=Streptomyces sp. NPDC056660 TaxID=3345897 RepID=UPI0036C39A99
MTGTTQTPMVESLGRIDPERSACVLIGVDNYAHLDPLRSVKHNLTELRDALTDPDIWGIPDDQKRIRSVPNPTSPADLVRPIRQAAELAEDTLIVYYAGHGLIDRHERQLLLTLPDSVEDQPDTCVRSSDVRRAIRDTGAALRRVLILDCCFSGQVLTEMTDGHRQDVETALRTLHDVEGAYVMTSAPRDRPSHAPDPKRCTLFTGALVDVMRQGLADGPETLSLRDLFQEVRKRIVAIRPEVPQEPQDEDHNGVGGLGFVRNAAVSPRRITGPPPSPPTRWQRVRTPVLSVTAGALGLVLGLGTQPLVHWWHDTHPAAAAGPCAVPSPSDAAAPRAVLLDHSDKLNKANVDYEKIYGLSALALVSQGKHVKALALADNSPGRVWPLTLGSPFDLSPSADTAVPLRHADGKLFDNWYDGEAMVIERGGGTDGRTMLIAAETGPAIRRFDIATGRQLGKDFPIRKELRYWPRGSAQTGRSIESLTASPDGRHLYAGWEAPLAEDGDQRGRGIIRIQRYSGTSGGSYTPDWQYAFLADDGMYLSELTAIDDDGHLLALERQYTAGLGTAIRIVELSVADAADVTGMTSLWHQPARILASTELVVDLATCPVGGPGQVAVPSSSPEHPLVDNAEGMALGTPWTSGRYKGWRPLYLVSDDNDSGDQITRLYSFAVKLRP